jgi:hypothetical protein
MEEELCVADPNSMLIWWPAIKNLGIPVPRTEIFPIDRDEVLQSLENETSHINREDWLAIQNGADRMGYPLFLRTDLSSGKHDWKHTCFVPEPTSSLYEHVLTLCEQHELWTLIGLDYQAIVLREFLELETAFTAFSGDMPINKEFRFFVRDGAAICHHFYWPEEAFNQHPARMAHEPNWKEKLRSLSELTDWEYLLLEDYAKRVGTALPGFWSVDFAKGTNGTWYLIDMALGKNSYHWPGCVNG